MAMHENAPRDKETVRDLRKKIEFVSDEERAEYSRREAREAEKFEARHLLEMRDNLRELAPGIDMEAFDRCIGLDDREQVRVISCLNENLSSARVHFGSLSPNGVQAINRYLQQSDFQTVDHRVSLLGGILSSDMDRTQMPSSLRKKVVPLALDFNHVQILEVSDSGARVIVTDPDGNRILNEVYPE